jgi:hypothetical protein
MIELYGLSITHGYSALEQAEEHLEGVLGQISEIRKLGSGGRTPLRLCMY